MRQTNRELSSCDQLNEIPAPSTREKINEIIAVDHVTMMMSIINMPKCRAEDSNAVCDRSSCAKWDSCGVDINDKLFNIMCSAFDDFIHEHTAMRQFNSGSYFDIHSAQHSDLMKEISEVIRRFEETENRREAIDDFRKISEMLEYHIRSSDSEMLAQQHS